MQGLAHFAFGMAMALFLFTVLEIDDRYELPLVVASGVWALLSDFWWPFREAGHHSLAEVGRTAHQSAFTNIFWFHGLLDRLETAHPRTETALMLVFLGVATAVHFWVNDNL